MKKTITLQNICAILTTSTKLSLYTVLYIQSFLRIILTEQVNIHLQFQNRGNIKELIQQKYIFNAINVSE